MQDSIFQENIRLFYIKKKKKSVLSSSVLFVKCSVCEVFKACALQSFFSAYVHLHGDENTSFLTEAH